MPDTIKGRSSKASAGKAAANLERKVGKLEAKSVIPNIGRYQSGNNIVAGRGDGLVTFYDNDGQEQLGVVVGGKLRAIVTAEV